MVMRMLEAGGIEPLTDVVRKADADNPRGYYEYEPVKQLDKDASWMGLAVGKALKVVSFLLDSLPREHNYSVLFINRSLDEVLASQQAMLLRRVEAGEIEADVADPIRLKQENERLRHVYRRHLHRTRQWLNVQPNVRTLFIEHQHALNEPATVANAVNAFLGGDLNETAMTNTVEKNLYRQRF